MRNRGRLLWLVKHETGLDAMNRSLARDLTAAGFPIRSFRLGQKFYPNETHTQWSEASHRSGIFITHYELQNNAREIEAGCYCPNLADLIEACGERFAHLSVEAALWTAVAANPPTIAMGHSAEEAVAKLWLTLPSGHDNKSRTGFPGGRLSADAQ
jgi:hypothetical protein